MYGVVQKKIRNDRDVTRLLTESMAGMASIIVMAFFAGQFVEHFKYSGLDRMLAMTGGQALGQAALPTSMLLVAFIGMTMCFNMFVGSMSAKYTMFAPIFHTDVHDGRDCAGVDAVRLPHRRLGDQLHHAAQPVHGHHAGLHEEHRAQGRHGHADLDDATV